MASILFGFSTAPSGPNVTSEPKTSIKDNIEEVLIVVGF